MSKVADLIIDHPPLMCLGYKQVATHKPSREFGDRYYVAAQTPFGKMESLVPKAVFEAAERLRDEEGILLHLVPRQELVKGQYNKGGFFFQLDIVDVTSVPPDFGNTARKSSVLKSPL